MDICLEEYSRTFTHRFPVSARARKAQADVFIDTACRASHAEDPLRAIRALKSAAECLYSPAGDRSVWWEGAVQGSLSDGLSSISGGGEVLLTQRAGRYVDHQLYCLVDGHGLRKSAGVPTYRFWWFLTLLGIAMDGHIQDSARVLAEIRARHGADRPILAEVGNAVGALAPQVLFAARELSDLCLWLVQHATRIELPKGVPAGVIALIIAVLYREVEGSLNTEFHSMIQQSFTRISPGRTEALAAARTSHSLVRVPLPLR